MRRINYIYFGLYFLILSTLSAASIFIKEPLTESRIFFFLYALAQTGIEVLVFVSISLLLQSLSLIKTHLAFIGLTFTLFIFHFLDFLLDRILDISVWQALSAFVLNESLSNFLFLLDASGIPLWSWLLIFASLASLPFLGIALYQFSEKISHFKTPIRIEKIVSLLFFFSASLLFWDFSGSKIIHPNTYTAFIQSLPWKSTFLQPKNVVLDLPGRLTQPSSEKEILAKIENAKGEVLNKPNIFLFVIESFRNDFIDKNAAPNLSALKERSVQIEMPLSNANASHISWFSIFHSELPHHWKKVQEMGWKMGSPSLHYLKKLGYKIHLYSSAQLSYYGMEKLLFGENNYLLDQNNTFHHSPPIQASETDFKAISLLSQDLKTKPELSEGNVFLIFLDSTHFDYSWPKNWIPSFTPFASELAYFKTFYHPDKIELIKNRYRNAVHYVDHLFGILWQDLKEKEDSIVVVTGDHGEEFFERGHLFHGSHLTKEQTSVPIFMKLNKNSHEYKTKIFSQMDIFPSILSSITKESPSFLKGSSILENQGCQSVTIARFNAGMTPYEFCLQNDRYKMIAQFIEKTNIQNARQIQIMSVKTKDDDILYHTSEELKPWIQKEFGPAIQSLFKAEIPSLPSSPKGSQ